MRKDDLIGIRKARFASFVLLIVCFAAMFVVLVLSAASLNAYIAAVVVLAALIIFWWFFYRRLLFSEAAFFDALTADMRTVNTQRRILESTVKHTPDGAVIVSEDEEFVIVNEAAKSLLAMFDGDTDVASYDEYAAGFNKNLTRAAILEAAKENRADETFESGGQHYKIRYITLAPEKGWGGGAVAVIADVTEYTNVENMQKEFVANISHELRTPLSSVKAYAETLLMDTGSDPDTMEEFLGIIVAEADRMTQMVENELSWSWLDEKGATINASETDLTALVKQAMGARLEELAKKKSITVNRMFADKRLNIEIDRALIQRVLTNVLENSIKYTDEKGRIDVDIIPSQNCVQIVISDNGAGIPEEDLSRVFERFYRVEKSRTRDIEGTGLGLAISKKIVEMHGGTIGIESQVGEGTRVIVTLPTTRSRGTAGIL